MKDVQVANTLDRHNPLKPDALVGSTLRSLRYRVAWQKNNSHRRRLFAWLTKSVASLLILFVRARMAITRNTQGAQMCASEGHPSVASESNWRIMFCKRYNPRRLVSLVANSSVRPPTQRQRTWSVLSLHVAIPSISLTTRQPTGFRDTCISNKDIRPTIRRAPRNLARNMLTKDEFEPTLCEPKCVCARVCVCVRISVRTSFRSSVSSCMSTLNAYRLPCRPPACVLLSVSPFSCCATRSISPV